MPAYKDEKHGTWYVVMRYTDWTGKRRTTTKRGFETKREAKEWEAEAVRVNGKTPDITLGSLCTLYVEDLRKRRKPATVYTQEHIIKKYILPYLADTPVDHIGAAEIRAWQNQIMQLTSIITKEKLSQHTLRNISVCLSSVFNFGVRFHGLLNNPIKIARGMGHSEAHVEFWEPEEFEKFLSVIPDDDEKLYFTVLYTSGMRVGEFLALTEPDLDYRKNTIRINKTYNWKLKISGPPKTRDSIRTISMPAHIMRQLHDFVKRYYSPPERIFEATTHKILSLRLRKYIELAGVKKIRIHDIRHSHASFLIHQGIPVTAIAQRLGHKNPKITLEVYSHVFAGADNDIAEKINNCFQTVFTA